MAFAVELVAPEGADDFAFAYIYQHPDKTYTMDDRPKPEELVWAGTIEEYDELVEAINTVGREKRNAVPR